MQNNYGLQQQIKVVNERTGLANFTIEKDFYLTQMIALISAISHEMYELILQGGTSLSKAYDLTERMSEDCDFRVRFKGPKLLSRTQKRNALRQLRKQVISEMKKQGFHVPEEGIKVRNEGQYLQIEAYYTSMYVLPQETTLKPFLKLEFSLAHVQEKPEERSVTTLIKKHLGDKVDHPKTGVSCLAVIETAAEKWVGLTRRVATAATSGKKGYDDHNLVRHLYDLYKIKASGYFNERFYELVLPIMLHDQERFQKDNANYCDRPTEEIKRAISELTTLPEWRNHYGVFVDDMVYAKERPTYGQVIGHLTNISQQALLRLEEGRCLAV